MALLSFEKSDDGTFVQARSLDALWLEAEAIGRVRLEACLSSGYQATVNFQTKSGSSVFAHGKGDRAAEALQAAISEARSLGADRV